MPSVTYSCPDCEGRLKASFDDQAVSATCATCARQSSILAPEYEDGRLRRCLVCPSNELFVRKDFPQRLGVAIVVTGFVASCVTWANHHVLATFAILFGTALIDVVLYLVMGDMLECYRCHAQYRGIPDLDEYERFDLEVHERHRQQKHRLEEARRVDG